MDSQTLRVQIFQEKRMHSEARRNKWIEQLICQCTCDQNTSGVTDQVASLIRVFEQENQLIKSPHFRIQLNWIINRTILPCRIKLSRKINYLG